MADFKVGDKMRLKSRGPEMTVDSVKAPNPFAEFVSEFGQTAEPEVWCVWFKGSPRMRELFPVATLEPLN